MARLSWNVLVAKLGKREKCWALLWVAVVLTLAQGRWLIQPRFQQLQGLSHQIRVLEEERIALLAQQPDLKRQQAEMAELKGQIGTLYEQLLNAERDLLDFQDVDLLLDSLVRDREKFEIYLNSVRPVERQTEAPVAGASLGSSPTARTAPYKKLFVQLDFYSTFKGFLDYLGLLERMRPYQRIEGIQVKVEGQDVTRPHAVLLLSVLMGDTLQARQAQREEIFASLEEVASQERKDPFLTADRPKEVVSAVGLKLTGVLFDGNRPVAAMIDDEIYHVGQVIQGKRVVAIEADRVFLEQGNRRFILLFTQEGGS